MSDINGKRVWYFPDAEMPPAGDSLLKGHESLIILNDNDERALIKITLFFTDREPIDNIDVVVEPKRVRCLRTNNVEDFGGVEIPLETQYAIKIESNVPVVAQYGRLDTRQNNMAFYTTMGFGA